MPPGPAAELPAHEPRQAAGAGSSGTHPTVLPGSLPSLPRSLSRSLSRSLLRSLSSRLSETALLDTTVFVAHSSPSFTEALASIPSPQCMHAVLLPEIDLRWQEGNFHHLRSDACACAAPLNQHLHCGARDTACMSYCSGLVVVLGW